MIVDDELVLGPVDAFVGITEVVTIGVVVEALGITAVVEASLSTICPFSQDHDSSLEFRYISRLRSLLLHGL